MAKPERIIQCNHYWRIHTHTQSCDGYSIHHTSIHLIVLEKNGKNGFCVAITNIGRSKSSSIAPKCSITIFGSNITINCNQRIMCAEARTIFAHFLCSINISLLYSVQSFTLFTTLTHSCNLSRFAASSSSRLYTI